jgi:hypothetical protein
MNAQQPPQRHPTLYLVYATPLNGGSVIEDTVAAGDENDAYQKREACIHATATM